MPHKFRKREIGFWGDSAVSPDDEYPRKRGILVHAKRKIGSMETPRGNGTRVRAHAETTAILRTL